MDLLKERIRKDGIVKEGNVLKVDSFLNHQMDIELINEIGKEFKRLFTNKPINKILTIEASGIGIACIVAQYFSVPVVFAKKSKSINLEGEMYVSKVESYTHKKTFDIIVSKKFLNENILIIDDFLANGYAVQGLIDIIKESGACLEGVGIVIEKGFQDGGKLLRKEGIHLESLAIIKSMDAINGTVEFEL
jgi:xanthine phosphoribosyltransferase